MTPSTITGDDYMFEVHAKLGTSLRHYPHISLVTIIDGVRIGVRRCKSIINTENWQIKFQSPFACVVLMRGRVHSNKSAAMEMHQAPLNGFRMLPNSFGLKINIKLKGTNQSDHHLSIRLELLCVRVVGIVSSVAR